MMWRFLKRANPRLDIDQELVPKWLQNNNFSFKMILKLMNDEWSTKFAKF